MKKYLWRAVIEGDFQAGDDPFRSRLPPLCISAGFGWIEVPRNTRQRVWGSTRCRLIRAMRQAQELAIAAATQARWQKRRFVRVVENTPESATAHFHQGRSQPSVSPRLRQEVQAVLRRGEGGLNSVDAAA
jgi:hypothetical protein